MTAMVPIASAVLTQNADLSITNIPLTYNHLQIRVVARSSTSSATDFLFIRLGATFLDFGSNYVGHKLIGDGSVIASGYNAQNTFIEMPVVPAASTDRFIRGLAIAEILDYSSANKYKTVKCIGGYDANGSGNIRLQSGLYMNTGSISQITFSTGTGFAAAGSRIDVYGISTSGATGI